MKKIILKFSNEINDLSEFINEKNKVSIDNHLLPFLKEAFENRKQIFNSSESDFQFKKKLDLHLFYEIEVPLNLVEIITKVFNNNDLISSVEIDNGIELFNSECLNTSTLINQYSLNVTHGKEAWGEVNEEKATKIKIAVVDSGLNFNHIDIKDKIININEKILGVNTITDFEYPYLNLSNLEDNNGHGSHCAGIAVANSHNGEGMFGSNIFAKIIPVKVIDMVNGIIFNSISYSAKGIIDAADLGADVISCSWGIKSERDSELLHAAINYALEKKCIVVFAAGNNFENTNLYTPQRHPGIICVAASTMEENKEEYWADSNYGKEVNIYAPGGKIISLDKKGNNYLEMSGTSMACPFVAGVIGLMLSKNRNLTTNEIKEILNRTAKQMPIYDLQGWDGETQIDIIGKRIDNLAAVQA